MDAVDLDAPTTWVSERGACALLEALTLLGPTTSRRVLAAGAAGAPVRAGRTVTYDAALVQALAERSHVSQDEVDVACPGGLLLGRLGPERGFRLSLSEEDQREAVAGGWSMPGLNRLLTHALTRRRGARLPFVGTVAGFVLVGADVVDAVPDPQGRGARLVLEPPGPWFESFRDRCLQTGRGGRALLFRGVRG
jgi:hypothetical protein